MIGLGLVKLKKEKTRSFFFPEWGGEWLDMRQIPNCKMSNLHEENAKQ